MERREKKKKREYWSKRERERERAERERRERESARERRESGEREREREREREKKKKKKEEEEENMQLLVRPFTGPSVVLEVSRDDRVSSVKLALEGRTGIPSQHQRLLFCSRSLNDELSVRECSCSHGSTLQLVGRLLGGKGGFGSQLRSSRTAVQTTNFDACRDLRGRRIQQAEAEKKLAEWKAREEERKMEQVAEKHLKKLAKTEARKEEVKLNIQEFNEQIENTSEKVASAVKRGLLQAGKGKGMAGSKRKEEESKGGTSSKKMRTWGLELDSDSEDSESE